jgi:hypothetical protein
MEIVHGLTAGIAQRLPGVALVELWTWLFDRDERVAISAIPGVEDLRDIAPPLRADPVSLGMAGVARLPLRLRYSLPVFPVLQARLRRARS